MKLEQQWKFIDNYKRKRYLSFELKYKLLKSFTKIQYVPISQLIYINYKKNNQPRNSKLIQINNRCLLTGRNRTVLKKFKLSRFFFRNLSNKGLIPGVKRHSF